VVINTLLANESELEKLNAVLLQPSASNKCVYLGSFGCLWTLKPIVCQMFLCDPVLEKVFQENQAAEQQWLDFKKREKTFKWPDQPVLFDELELIFIKQTAQKSR